jgi:hypothetical protein
MKIQIKTPLSFLCSRINLLNNNKLTDMHEWEKQSVEKAKVKLYPTFYKKAPEIQLIDNLENVHKAFVAMSQGAYLRMLESERGTEILASAKKYHIAYNKDDIDWLHLIDQIENYEELLQQAKNNNLIWDSKNYDPIGLKQLIEDDISQEREWSRDQNSDYLETRI